MYEFIILFFSFLSASVINFQKSNLVRIMKVLILFKQYIEISLIVHFIAVIFLCLYVYSFVIFVID